MPPGLSVVLRVGGVEGGVGWSDAPPTKGGTARPPGHTELPSRGLAPARGWNGLPVSVAEFWDRHTAGGIEVFGAVGRETGAFVEPASPGVVPQHPQQHRP